MAPRRKKTTKSDESAELQTALLAHPVSAPPPVVEDSASTAAKVLEDTRVRLVEALQQKAILERQVEELTRANQRVKALEDLVAAQRDRMNSVERGSDGRVGVLTDQLRNAGVRIGAVEQALRSSARTIEELQRLVEAAEHRCGEREQQCDTLARALEVARDQLAEREDAAQLLLATRARLALLEEAAVEAGHQLVSVEAERDELRERLARAVSGTA